MPTNADERVVVVVEDDDAIREMLCELLPLAGFKVFGCKDGIEGLRAAQELKPSVLTLDLHMPRMDGVEVLSKLEGDEATARLPVVIVSAYSSDRRVRGCKQVKAIIQKPFDVEELFSKVRLAANGN